MGIFNDLGFKNRNGVLVAPDSEKIGGLTATELMANAAGGTQNVYGSQQVATFSISATQNVVVGSILPFSFTGSIVDSGTSNKMKLIAGKSYQFTYSMRINGIDGQTGESAMVAFFNDENEYISSQFDIYQQNSATGWSPNGMYMFSVIPTKDEMVHITWTGESPNAAEIDDIQLQIVETSFAKPMNGIMNYGQWLYEGPNSNIANGAKVPTFTVKNGGSLNSTSSTDFVCKAGVTYRIETSFAILGSNANGFYFRYKESDGNWIGNTAFLVAATQSRNYDYDMGINFYYKPDVDTTISLYNTSGVAVINTLTNTIITEISTAEVSLGNYFINGKQFDENNNIDLEGYSTLSSPVLGQEILTEERHFKTGKPIYKKTIDFGALPKATTKTLTLDWEFTPEECWVDMTDSFAYFSSSGKRYGINHSATASPNSWNVEILYPSLTMVTGSDRTAYSAYVTVKYTKTTDTANSPVRLIGPSVTDFEMAPYSTTEQLTERRWVDGKPIYRTVLPPVVWTGNDITIPFDNGLETMVYKTMLINKVETAGESHWVNDTTENRITYNMATKSFVLYYYDGAAWANGTEFVVIAEYTKTADTASSPVRTIKVTDNLPAVTAADVGKTLLIDSNGAYKFDYVELGSGQTWQDVTTSRALGKPEVNNTGRAIYVYIEGTGSLVARDLIFYVDGLYSRYTNPETTLASILVVVPNNSTYSLNLATGGWTKWKELR